MTTADLPCISRLEKSAGPYPWNTQHFQDSLKSGHCCKVALKKGEIIGHGVIMTIMDESHLLILSIDKSYQGQGIGKALLRHLIEEAAAQSASTLFLEVRDSNEKAFQLYLNEGFNEVGRRKDYYPAKEKREDAIVMALDLDAYQEY